MKKLLKNNLKIVIILGVIIAVVFTGFVFAFADQENELEFCDHEYSVTAFETESGTATLVCDECGDTIYDKFSDHVNERGYEPLDMNNDGIVNGKDFAYMMHNYTNNN